MKHQQRVYLTHPKMPALVRGFLYLLTLTTTAIVSLRLLPVTSFAGNTSGCDMVKHATSSNGNLRAQVQQITWRESLARWIMAGLQSLWTLKHAGKGMLSLVLVGWGIITPALAAEKAGVCLYEHVNYNGWTNGRSLCRYYDANNNIDDVPNFVNVNFNDLASSVKIIRPFEVELYQDVSFRGQKWSFKKNNSSLVKMAHDIVSSMKIFPKIVYLTVNKTGMGTVSASAQTWNQTINVNCGIMNPCSAVVLEGNNVILTTTPSTGYVFTGWTGACAGTSATCQVSMTQAQSVTATFKEDNKPNPDESIILSNGDAKMVAAPNSTSGSGTGIVDQGNGTYTANGVSVAVNSGNSTVNSDTFTIVTGKNVTGTGESSTMTVTSNPDGSQTMADDSFPGMKMKLLDNGSPTVTDTTFPGLVTTLNSDGSIKVTDEASPSTVFTVTPDGTPTVTDTAYPDLTTTLNPDGSATVTDITDPGLKITRQPDGSTTVNDTTTGLMATVNSDGTYNFIDPEAPEWTIIVNPTDWTTRAFDQRGNCVTENSNTNRGTRGLGTKLRNAVKKATNFVNKVAGRVNKAAQKVHKVASMINKGANFIIKSAPFVNKMATLVQSWALPRATGSCFFCALATVAKTIISVSTPGSPFLTFMTKVASFSQKVMVISSTVSKGATTSSKVATTINKVVDKLAKVFGWQLLHLRTGSVRATDASTTCPIINFNPAHLVNISTRAYTSTGLSSVIAGFIIQGTGDCTVMIRGFGKGIGISPLLDTQLLLQTFPDGRVLANNQSWATGNDINQIPPGLHLPDSSDAGILTKLSAGAYTATMTPESVVGVGLIGVDQVSCDADTQLVNISTRAEVRDNLEVVIAGFIIDGSGTLKIMLQGFGAGIGLSPCLDTNLRLDKFPASGDSIAVNDNWETATNATLIPAALKLPNNTDAGILVDLPAGAYTATMTHTTGSCTGIGLIGVNVVQ